MMSTKTRITESANWTDMPDPYLLDSEQRRNVNRNLESLFPEWVLKQSWLFVESEAKRARERVDGIKVILAHHHIELQPEELVELDSRAIDELPSFEAAAAVESHEEFIAVARLARRAKAESIDEKA